MINHYSTEMADKLGRKFKVGDKVVRAHKLGSHGVDIKISKVTRLEEQLYLDDSKVPIIYPGRLLIVTDIMEA